ncbi:AraC family transcriptional regulator [Terrimonas sp. NA20]|uniref:AraC family transcriptional regulator n=1 Tax=Terrimonas ginsenosidimutans TaxID=2908004 RepID=A0ABS9KS80_9BACT|nr:helix-turn-helix domain-containing protein [Terrimonas ginsenosidimutans]MCG2615196.1 AraC family transcriptional regulator [Terrimonas ginsenosidimutans]
MLFSFNEKSVILLMFFVHALVFACLLLVKGIRYSSASDRWLSFFMFLCALYIAPFMLGYAGWYSQENYRHLLFYMPFQQLFLIPPVLFFYMRSLLDKSFTIKKRHLLHFLPAVLYDLYSLLIFICDELVIGHSYFYEDGRDKDFAAWYQVAGFASMFVYLFASFVIYRRYRHYVFASLSFAEAVAYKWAERFIAALLVLLSLRLAFFIINPEWGEFGRKFWYYVCFSVSFYYISIHGLVNSVRQGVPLHIFSRASGSMLQGVLPGIKTEPEVNNSDTAAVIPDKVLDIDPEELALWKERINRVMNEAKLFENPVLTIADLAEKLAIHPKKASQWVNLGFGMNYNDFVNSYRVRSVLEKMERGEADLQTIIGLAFDAGFNSKSTFNRVFKKSTGLTPREYMAKLQQK